MADPTREVLVTIRDNLFRLAEEAADEVRAYDRKTDPPLFPRSFTAPYLTEQQEAEAIAEDNYERERA